MFLSPLKILAKDELDLLAQPAQSVKELGLGDLDKLKFFLEKWKLEESSDNELEIYFHTDFLRFCHAASLVPNGKGKLLELGANPYYTTSIINKLRGYHLELANYFGESAEKKGSQKLINTETGEEKIFNFNLFNSETDPFPYQEATFDVVLFCEILEHLILDPIRAISEINRVLKQGGYLILTTPNAARLDNIRRVMIGNSIYDPYSGYGLYGRHNREYVISEVWQILSLNGFQVERAFTANVTPSGRKLATSIKGRGLAGLTGRKHDLGEYLFFRAKKNNTCAQIRPTELFRSWGNL